MLRTVSFSPEICQTDCAKHKNSKKLARRTVKIKKNLKQKKPVKTIRIKEKWKDCGFLRRNNVLSNSFYRRRDFLPWGKVIFESLKGYLPKKNILAKSCFFTACPHCMSISRGSSFDSLVCSHIQGATWVIWIWFRPILWSLYSQIIPHNYILNRCSGPDWCIGDDGCGVGAHWFGC